MTPDQLPAMRRIAEAAVATERETGCPVELRSPQPSALWNRPGSRSAGEQLLWASRPRTTTAKLPHKGVLERRVDQPRS